ncbi:MAG: hypothetical protein D3924_20285 [Candidatus Electrothrix sp. AR4]|nr:hypothetical protein [Candidatus Electrothrix sp. AR4]
MSPSVQNQSSKTEGDEKEAARTEAQGQFSCASAAFTLLTGTTQLILLNYPTDTLNKNASRPEIQPVFHELVALLQICYLD